MKNIGAIFLWLVAVTATAQTNQTWDLYRFPLRAFGPGAVVNLAPLYQWWARQPTHAAGSAYLSADIAPDTNAPPENDRPLAAWQLVTGTHVSTAGNNWVVDAIVYTSPTARTNAHIILQHPPMAEEQEYYTWKAELKEATLEITNAARAYQADVKAEQTDQKHETTYYRGERRQTAVNNANNYAQLADQNQADASAQVSQQQQLQTARTQIEEQFKAIPAVKGIYYVNWFAVMRGYTKQGLPVYDMGRVAASP